MGFSKLTIANDIHLGLSVMVAMWQRCERTQLIPTKLPPFERG